MQNLSDLKKVNKSTKKILIGTLILFMLTEILFLYLLVNSDKNLNLNAIRILFFVYGAVYAILFRFSVQVAHKLKDLKIGFGIFLVFLLIGFGLLIYFL